MIVLDAPTLFDGMVAFLVISIRMGSMFLAAPLFSAAAVNLPQRTALTMGMTVAVFSAVKPPQIDYFSAQGFVVLAQEVIIGTMIGFFMQFAFATVTFAGEQISSAMGLSYAAMVDPQTGASSPVIAQFLSILLILIFLSLDGHHLLIRAVADSYKIVPIGEMMLKPKMFMTIFQSGGLIFSMALLISLPIVVAILLINIVIGVVTRVAPQLNIFSVGFPITILAGLVLMMVLIPSIAHAIAAYINEIGLKMRDFMLISQEG